jgi:hypothetical protein
MRELQASAAIDDESPMFAAIRRTVRLATGDVSAIEMLLAAAIGGMLAALVLPILH